MATNILVTTIVTASGLTYWSLVSPFELIGIPASVLFMSLIGTAAGLIINKPSQSRMGLFGLAFAYTTASSALAVVLGQIPGLDFINKVAPAAALIIAFFSQPLIPALRDALVSRVNKFGGDNKTEGDSK